MSQYNDTGYGTVILTATVAQYQRVTALGAVGVLASIPFGVAREQGISGEAIGVAFVNKQGTTKMIAIKAIAKGVKVYTTTVGKVTDTFATGGFVVGVSAEAAGADNDVIEVMLMPSGVTGA